MLWTSYNRKGSVCLNDWKRILEQLPYDNTDKKTFQTTEINIKVPKAKRILGVRPVLFWICLIVLCLIITGSGFWLYIAVNEVKDYDRIYPGVTALGVNLDGMTVEQAKIAINEYSDNYYSGKEIVIRCLDQTVVITAKQAVTGVDADYIANMAYAYGRDRGFFARYKLIHSGKQHELSVSTNYTVDRSYIEKTVDGLIRAVNRDYKYFEIEYLDSGIHIKRGQDGISVRRGELLGEIEKMLSSNSFGELNVEPDIQKAVVPDVEAIRNTIFVEAKDAELVKTGKKTYKIEKEKNGVDINIEQLRADLEKSDWDIKFYPFIYQEAEMTEAELKAVLFKDVLSEFTTKLSINEINRTTNIRLAAEHIDGVVLRPANGSTPGDRFSFNDVVGERTEARGFKTAKVFAQGEIVDDIGGGICQVSSTLFVAALYADMGDIERHVHAFPVAYVDFGYDATVQYGYLDFAFRNNTPYPIKLDVKLVENELRVKILGTITNPNKKVELSNEFIREIPYEVQYRENEALPLGTHKPVRDGKNGYEYKLYQKIYEGSTVVTVNEYYSRYSPQHEIIEIHSPPT
jgi:vancomycin resistance protein YoaR